MGLEGAFGAIESQSEREDGTRFYFLIISCLTGLFWFGEAAAAIYAS